MAPPVTGGRHSYFHGPGGVGARASDKDATRGNAAPRPARAEAAPPALHDDGSPLNEGEKTGFSKYEVRGMTGATALHREAR